MALRRRGADSFCNVIVGGFDEDQETWRLVFDQWIS